MTIRGAGRHATTLPLHRRGSRRLPPPRRGVPITSRASAPRSIAPRPPVGPTPEPEPDEARPGHARPTPSSNSVIARAARPPQPVPSTLISRLRDQVALRLALRRGAGAAARHRRRRRGHRRRRPGHGRPSGLARTRSGRWWPRCGRASTRPPRRLRTPVRAPRPPPPRSRQPRTGPIHCHGTRRRSAAPPSPRSCPERPPSSGVRDLDRGPRALGRHTRRLGDSRHRAGRRRRLGRPDGGAVRRASPPGSPSRRPPAPALAAGGGPGGAGADRQPGGDPPRGLLAGGPPTHHPGAGWRRCDPPWRPRRSLPPASRRRPRAPRASARRRPRRRCPHRRSRSRPTGPVAPGGSSRTSAAAIVETGTVYTRIVFDLGRLRCQSDRDRELPDTTTMVITFPGRSTPRSRLGVERQWWPGHRGHPPERFPAGPPDHPLQGRHGEGLRLPSERGSGELSAAAPLLRPRLTRSTRRTPAARFRLGYSRRARPGLPGLRRPCSSWCA